MHRVINRSEILGTCGLACFLTCILAPPVLAGGHVGVYLGAGDSSSVFVEAGYFPVGDSPQAIQLADLDGDGDLDAVVTNWGSDDVSVLPGNGDGSFGEGTMIATGIGPMDVDIGDLDGDGILDMVVTRPKRNNVSLIRGVGDGTFETADYFHVEGEPWAAALGDLNHDGRLDLVVSVWQLGIIQIMLAVDEPEFARGEYIAEFGTGGDEAPFGTGEALDPQDPWAFAIFRALFDANSRDIELEDVNGDGILDIIATQWLLGVLISRGVGDGTFAMPVVHWTGLGPEALATGNIDQDGVIDVAIANRHAQGVTLLRGESDGRLTHLDSLRVEGSPVDVAIAEFTGDGNQDLLVLISEGAAELHPGIGGGHFGDPLLVEIGAHPQAMGVGDLNGDGVQDLAVLTYGGAPLHEDLEPEKPPFIHEAALTAGPVYPNGDVGAYTRDGGGLNLRLVTSYQPVPGVSFWSWMGANFYSGTSNTLFIPIPDGPTLEAERSISEANVSLHFGVQFSPAKGHVFFRPRVGIGPGFYYFWTEENLKGDAIELHETRNKQFRAGWRGSLGLDLQVTRKVGVSLDFIYDRVWDLDQGVVEGRSDTSRGRFVAWNIGAVFAVGP